MVNSWYNGLLVTVRKPLSHGVEVLANYTFSKSLDDGPSKKTSEHFQAPMLS